MERKKEKAKSKRKKTTISQKVVNVASTGMPSPVRKFLGARFVALLIVATLPVLFATGLVSLRWENGRPRLSVNRQKTEAVKQEAAERLQERHEDLAERRSADDNIFTRSRESQESGSIFGSDRQEHSGFGEKVADRFGGDQSQAATTEQEHADGQASGPLSKLKDRFEKRR